MRAKIVKIPLKINSSEKALLMMMPERRDRLMQRRPIPISSKISLYSCSTDFVFDPTSPFLIFVMCLSNRVVSKKVITKTATLKPVINR